MHNRSDLNRTRWWDLPSVLLLLVLLTTAFTRLVATRWSENLDTVRIISYLGLVTGLALGYSRFSPRLVGLLGFVYGLFVVPWRLGLATGEGIGWMERIQSLAGRLGIIFNYLIQQRAVPDNLLFILLMGILFWFISVHAAYTLVRYANPWLIALPSGLAIVLIHNYDSVDPNHIWYLIIYLFLTLVLVARLVYLNQRRRWEQSRTFLPSYLGTDVIRFAIVACLLIVALSWATPALARALPAAKTSWDRVVTPWWNDMRNVFENAFASLRSTVGLSGEFYGPNLSLGQGNILSDTVIFTVQTPVFPPEGVRYYWRARVYDIYDNGWESSLQTSRALDAQQMALKFPDMLDNQSGTPNFAFYLNRPIATILAPNQPVWLSRPSRAELAYNPDGSADLGVLRATPSLRAGEIYTVRASFNKLSVEGLRAAGEDYPAWVLARYLQIPASVTPRTRQLAAQIAGGQETSYDIANAVTNYLRSNYEYTETVPPLPTNQDLIDWFLFDLQSGFCNYYASSEVILLRLAGVPARLAVGYASGDNVDVPEMYTVRQRDAHAWPEVYFPGVGWVEFEPTVSQPALTRPETIAAPNDLDNPLVPGDSLANLEPEPPLDRTSDLGDINTQGVWRQRIAMILTGLLTIVLIGLGISVIRRKKLYKKVPLLPLFLEKVFIRAGLKPPRVLHDLAILAGLTPLERAYQQINLALARLGKRPSPTLTPAERARTLAERLPATREPGRALVSEYHKAIYSPHRLADQDSAQRAGESIRNLSLRALIRRRFGI